ncbi:hypothetical protein D623_10028444 [Myotis brandtii]|uniref:Uncharacterized protein n=1 Tax=Myotis brandtii TaxID=109478 RepID=S7NHT8_MYOBR|nr:hypothetical protein D623_10028444 [Myotis brandtii]
MAVAWRWRHQGLQAEDGHVASTTAHSTISGARATPPLPPKKALLNCQIPRLQKALYPALSRPMADGQATLV